MATHITPKRQMKFPQPPQIVTIERRMHLLSTITARNLPLSQPKSYPHTRQSHLFATAIFLWTSVFRKKMKKVCIFSKKVLTKLSARAIIVRLCERSQRSGCGAAGSALPWGGRGRKFKSCHSDQKSIGNTTFSNAFFTCYAAFTRGVTQFATQNV